MYRRLPVLQKLARFGIYWLHELLSIAFTKLPRLTKGMAMAGQNIWPGKCPMRICGDG